MDEERRRSNDRLIDEKFKGVHNEITATRELIDEKLDRIIVQTTRTNGTVAEHTRRINCLENWRWYIIGTAGGMGALFGVYQVLIHI